MVELKSFVKNYEDKSDDNGFQFVFYCDRCGNGYITRYKKYSLAKVSSALGVASSLFGGFFGRGAEAAEKARSYQWHSEHDKAFFEAVEEARPHFKQCPRCSRWVCFKCWNDAVGLCVDCAPRLTVETAKLAAETKVKAVEKYMEKKLEEGAFSGEVKAAAETMVTCPRCGKLTRPGKFCEFCGAPLTKRYCPKCGSEVSPNARFCSNCGARLI